MLSISVLSVSPNLRVLWLACWLVVGTSCDSPTEPVHWPDVTLEELRVSDIAVLRDSGLLVVVGVPVDTTQILPPHGRLRLELNTSAGDAEVFDVGPIVCDATSLACHDLSLTMKDGHTVWEVFDVFNPTPARPYAVAISDRVAGVFVFHPERVDAAIRSLNQHPAVQVAERSHFAVSPPPRKWGLRGGLPLDFRPPVAMDGVFQGLPGDTVTVRYSQPDGSLLTLEFLIPQP